MILFTLVYQISKTSAYIDGPFVDNQIIDIDRCNLDTFCKGVKKKNHKKKPSNEFTPYTLPGVPHRMCAMDGPTTMGGGTHVVRQTDL